MKHFYVIITALAATALAQGSIECNFTEATGTQQCYGAVGQLLVFHLPNTADRDVRLKKDKKYMILKLYTNQIESLHKEYVNHSNQTELFTKGRLELGKATKKHSGDYMLEEYSVNGNLIRKVNVHVEIEAPVSKPAVSQMCSSEQINIGCSSEGDGVEFRLTLDGNLLMQTKDNSQFLNSSRVNIQSLTGTRTTQDEPSLKHVTISLKSQLAGSLMCIVWNNVSKEETVIQLKICKGTVVDDPTKILILTVLQLCLNKTNRLSNSCSKKNSY
ncbi:uncharacterized protein LOC132988028 [Labrus mixtus]|uniref:uncharacterized protein LOC132988028 n=1 Tax=Labrus mixtus TaxID=508554 RepID=UPI0029C00917|nr:uncharacterized protein LOC132988028 [Labrus mixtus]XP_060911092.1 uncharacterized protein LOC132988028 [Labrus mixtus]